jgi:HrpA-like RNA helicase
MIYIYIYAEREEQVIMEAVQAHDVFVLAGATGRFIHTPTIYVYE